MNKASEAIDKQLAEIKNQINSSSESKKHQALEMLQHLTEQNHKHAKQLAIDLLLEQPKSRILYDMVRSMSKTEDLNVKPLLQTIRQKPEYLRYTTLRNSTHPEIEAFLLELLETLKYKWDIIEIFEYTGSEKALKAIDPFLKSKNLLERRAAKRVKPILLNRAALSLAKKLKLGKQNTELVNHLTKNQLTNSSESTQITGTIFFTYKPSRKITSRINKNKDLPFSIVKEESKADHFIVAPPNDYDDLIQLVEHLKGEKSFITEDQLKRNLETHEDLWIKDNDSDDSTANLIGLFISGNDNIKIALQMVESGGAKPEIMAIIAAIMMAHPEKTIAGKAERVFKKYASTPVFNNLKKSGMFLRRSGKSDAKIHQFFSKETGIVEAPFRLMHCIIASANNNVQDVNNNILQWTKSNITELSNYIGYFPIQGANFNKSSFTNLEELIEKLSHVENFYHLDLSGCKSKIPANIRNLNQLKYLNLTNNKIAESSILNGLHQLQTLIINTTKIGDISCISQMPNLRHLEAEGCMLKEIPQNIFNCKKLRDLSLRKNKIQHVPSNIKDLPLDEVNLGYNQLKFTEPLHLPKVRVLNLSGNNLKVFGPKQLKAPKLNELILNANQLTEFELSKNWLPKVYALSLDKNNLSAIDDSIFENGVSRFSAKKNQIKSIPKSFAKSRIYRMLLEDNQIEELPAHMFTMEKSIDNINLRRNKITKIDPAWKKMRYTYGWHLEGNPVDRFD